MPSLRDLHVTVAWVVVVSNGAAGTWALMAHRFAAARGRAVWWFVGFAQAAVAAQVALGAALLSDVEAPRFHVFYGVIALFSITILFGYRTQLRHRLYLLYGFGELFVMGLAIRSMTLGS